MTALAPHAFAVAGLPAVDGAAIPHVDAVTGTPRRWLRLEGLAMFAAAVGVFLINGGAWWALVPLLLAVDISAVGYLAGPRVGAFTYNLAHTWIIGIAVLALGAAVSSGPLLVAGAVLVAHVGMDRLAGYGLKYPSAFGDTHLGRIGGNGRNAR